MTSLILLFALLLLQFSHNVRAVDTIVNLSYTRFRGITNSNGVTSWLGMRYARRPVDSLRFAAPLDPLPDGRILDANKVGPICVGTASVIAAEFGGPESEDCLFVNVFAPTAANSNAKLPVYVFIQGGGFNSNGNANFDGTSLIQAAEMQAIIVNFNYRVGAYGFLASQEMKQNPSYAINAGLLDQRQALKWVQTHIAAFGGDPGHVTIGGASAGAGSVMLHLTAYGGRNDNLFHAATSESQAFPSLFSIKESESMFEALAKNANCVQSTAPARLDCLRKMPSVEFQKAHKATAGPYTGAPSKPIWYWGPTLDGIFIQDYTYNLFNEEKFVKVPIILGDATNEGTIFAPHDIASQAAADNFMKSNWPGLTPQNFNQLHSVFKQGSQYSGAGAWWSYAADLFGMTRYICPGTMVSDAFAKAKVQAIYNYRWDVKSSSNVNNGNGATHVGELGSVWWGGTGAGDDIHKQFASFIRSYDPNAHVSGKTKWSAWGSVGGNNRILYSNLGTTMEKVDATTISKCNILHSIGASIRQ